MERFVHRSNIEIYRKQLSYVADDAKREQLLKLLAEEEAKASSLQCPKQTT
jgi:hypothetical protein